MFSNNTLIDRLSNRFRKSEEEINDSIKYIFSRIAQFIVDGKVFYIYDLGYIYADKTPMLFLEMPILHSMFL